MMNEINYRRFNFASILLRVIIHIIITANSPNQEIALFEIRNSVLPADNATPYTLYYVLYSYDIGNITVIIIMRF